MREEDAKEALRAASELILRLDGVEKCMIALEYAQYDRHIHAQGHLETRLESRELKDALAPIKQITWLRAEDKQKLCEATSKPFKGGKHPIVIGKCDQPWKSVRYCMKGSRYVQTIGNVNIYDRQPIIYGCKGYTDEDKKIWGESLDEMYAMAGKGQFCRGKTFSQNMQELTKNCLSTKARVSRILEWYVEKGKTFPSKQQMTSLLLHLDYCGESSNGTHRRDIIEDAYCQSYQFWKN